MNGRERRERERESKYGIIRKAPKRDVLVDNKVGKINAQFVSFSIDYTNCTIAALSVVSLRAFLIPFACKSLSSHFNLPFPLQVPI